MKRKIFLIFVLIFSATNIFAQDDNDRLYGDDDDDNNTTNIISVPKLYLGIGGGFYYRAGLFGGIAEYRVSPNMYLTTSAGLGGWGIKGAIGGRYIFNDTKGLGISSSYYLSAGGSTIDLQNTTSSVSNNITTIELQPAHAINLSLAYHIPIMQKHRLGFEIGYTYQINKNPYIVKSSIQPDEMNEITLKIMQPQGIGVGMFFVFGL